MTESFHNLVATMCHAGAWLHTRCALDQKESPREKALKRRRLLKQEEKGKRLSFYQLAANF